MQMLYEKFLLTPLIFICVQWSVALECHRVSTCPSQRHLTRVRRVFPVFFGERDSLGTINDLFKSQIYKDLPETVPIVSLARAAALLRNLGIEPSPGFMDITIKSLVSLLYRIVSQMAHKDVSTALSSDRCIKRLRQILRDTRGAALSVTSSLCATSDADDKKAISSPKDGSECKRVVRSGSGTQMSSKQCLDALRDELGLCDSLTTPSDVINGALDWFGEDAIREECNRIESYKEKAIYVLRKA
jgi:hypothetical protein